MTSFPRWLRFWTAVLVVLYWSALQASPAAAALTPSRVSGTTTVTCARDADLLVVQRALENRIVAQKLRDYGMAPDEAQLRLASMSDNDLHTLASATKGLPTGGDATGAIIGVLLVILLVLLILKLMNREVVVK